VASTDLRVAARQLPGRGLAADLSLDSDDDSMVSSFEILVKFQAFAFLSFLDVCCDVLAIALSVMFVSYCEKKYLQEISKDTSKKV